MIHHLAPEPARASRTGARKGGGPAGEGGAVKGQPAGVFLYGRLAGLPRARLSERLVNIGWSLTRSPARAARAVIAHEAARRCTDADWGLALPFALPAGTALLSENALQRRLGRAAPAAPANIVPYAVEDVARLSGLPVAACDTLRLFDVLAPGGGPLGYPDLAAARHVAALRRQGVPLAAVVAAAAALGQRGLRLSHVRLAQAPWGGLVERSAAGLVELDGQFALVLDEDAGSAEDAFEAACAHEAAGDLPAAERDYHRAALIDRRDPVIPFNLGNVLVGQGRAAEAMAAFRSALARDPAFAEAAFNLGRLCEAQGEPAAAVPWYRAAIAAHPASPQALYNAARLLTEQEDFSGALPLWERFLALAPDDPDIGHARRLALLCRLQRPQP